MPHVSFLAECGNPGADGTTIDLSGLGLPERPLALLKDFDAAQAVARATVQKIECRAGLGLLVEADVPEQLLDAYPAIGIQVMQVQGNEQGGRTITACQLQSVSLSASPNADPTIKTLREQLAG